MKASASLTVTIAEPVVRSSALPIFGTQTGPANRILEVTSLISGTHDDDFVLATGETRTVREFVAAAFGELDIAIDWDGEGVGEQGRNRATGDVLVRVDPRYFRPTEVDLLIGDASKARTKLGWAPTTQFADMVREMVRSDVRVVAEEARHRRPDSEG